MEPERLVVGRVVKPHGILGEVSIEVLSDAPERFAPRSQMLAGGREVVVVASRPHQGRLLVRFEGVADRNGAEVLRGLLLTIPASEAAPLDEWSFYPHDLHGCAVVAEDGSKIGTMLRVEESPANDLWVVDAGGREVLVPAVRAIVIAVDVEARRITVRLPEGLL
ncbi:MAG: ribosome maturation factor RimM [Actinomycetota bacterium]